MSDRKDDQHLGAKSTETFSKPLITLIYTDGGVELAPEKQRSHKIPGLAFQVYHEMRNWSFGEVYENELVHGVKKKRLYFERRVDEKLPLKSLVPLGGWGDYQCVSVRISGESFVRTLPRFPKLGRRSLPEFDVVETTVICTDGAVELAGEKERSHKIPGLPFQVYRELRNGSLQEAYENVGVQG